jgi:hypothetical protein
LAYDFVHDLEKKVEDIDGIGGLLAWLINTGISALIGLIVGAIVVAVVSRFHSKSDDESH